MMLLMGASWRDGSMDRTQRILDGRDRLKTSQLEGGKSSDLDVLSHWRCQVCVEMGFRRNLSRQFLNVSRFWGYS